jgi:hypothetical protein
MPCEGTPYTTPRIGVSLFLWYNGRSFFKKTIIDISNTPYATKNQIISADFHVLGVGKAPRLTGLFGVFLARKDEKVHP